MVGGLGDLEDTADVGNGLALGNQLISRFELAVDLLKCEDSSFHDGVPGPAWPDEPKRGVIIPGDNPPRLIL